MSTHEAARAALAEYADQADVIDTHEHLPQEAERLAATLDAFTLFSKYCPGDLRAAGMDAESLGSLFIPATSLERKWELFHPFYSLIRDGSLSRAARIGLEKFYGCTDLTSLEDAQLVTRRMRAGNTSGLYARILGTACRISTCLNYTAVTRASEFLTPVATVAPFCDISSFEQLAEVGKEIGGVYPTLGRYLDALGDYVVRVKKEGTRGIKFETAYRRDLRFQSTTTASAEHLYGRIFEESRGSRRNVLGFEESLPLQDYLVHRLVELAGTLDLVVTFHTGTQARGIPAGTENDITAGRPDRLWNLAFRYRGTRFLLLHGGFPWTEEAGIMAKHFPNVWVDMSWMHIVSPEISRRALREWIDLVPRSKILGFGGDHRLVEGVYGHLVMAKENICHALAAAVESGALGIADARRWVSSLLHDNPEQVYGLT